MPKPLYHQWPHPLSTTLVFFFFPLNSLILASPSLDNFSILNNPFDGDYSPPSPPPPTPPPHPPSLSCQQLQAIGSLNTTCHLNTTLNFTHDLYISGAGNFHILPGVNLSCLQLGCSITINISGDFSLGSNSEILSGTVYIVAGNVSLLDGSVINVTALAGHPPEHTTGTPKGMRGGGGGHGGRGASCVMDSDELPEEVWGGEVYSWYSLDQPWSYGSKGGTTSEEEDYGGEGGGRIWIEVESNVNARGSLFADGGDGGVKGGGGSGGSIYIKSHKM